MKYENLDENQCTLIIAELDKLLNGSEVLKHLNINLTNASYTDSEINLKMNLRLKSAPSREIEALEAVARELDIDITKIGPNGEKLVGYLGRKRKKPFVIETVEGQECILSQDDTQFFFGTFAKPVLHS